MFLAQVTQGIIQSPVPKRSCNHSQNERALYFQESVADLSIDSFDVFVYYVTGRFLDRWFQTRIIMKTLVPNLPGVVSRVVPYFVEILG